MATLVARPVRTRLADDVFFTTMAYLMLVIVVIGFAPSYFLRGAVFAKLPSLLVHLHGAVFSAWIILFAVQSSLVAAGNVRLHRRLGVLGAVIACLMVVLGVITPIGTLRRGAVLPPFFTPTTFLINNAIGILIFGAFVAVAVWKRNDRRVHKRLMLIANCMLLPPALSRVLYNSYPFLIGAIPIALIVALFVFDLVLLRKILLVSVVGLAAFLLTNPFADAVGKTAPAQRVVAWAQGHA